MIANRANILIRIGATMIAAAMLAACAAARPSMSRERPIMIATGACILWRMDRRDGLPRSGVATVSCARP